MIARYLFLLLIGLAATPLQATQAVPQGARTLTIQLFSTRTVKALAVTQQYQTPPLHVEWIPTGMRLSSGAMVKQLSLSGKLRMQAGSDAEGDSQRILAAGQWTIAWRPTGLRVLLTLPSETYVTAALNGEAAPDEPTASLQAMAIAIRTFALLNAHRHRSEDFDFCDSTHCQALRLGNARPEVERAVRETAGETLWFGARQAHVYYTQHCGGMSESAASVWPAEHAGYLVGHRADPYCLRHSPAQWHARITLTQLSDIFRAQGWHTPSPIEAVGVTRRSAGGRAELLLVSGRGAPSILSASSFRFAVDRALGWNQMRSDWYTISLAGPNLEFSGRGYGHGVGLCQAGAYEMAVQGHNPADILSFYFPGTVAAIAPGGRGYQDVTGAGWTLRSTNPTGQLIAEGNAAWGRAQTLLPLAASPHPTVQELPNTELFRQTTAEPGWVLASTRGSHVFLQPSAVRRSNGTTEALLLHEFLHVLIEQQAGDKAPLWLREGLAEALANPPANPEDKKGFAAGIAVNELNETLAHPAGVSDSRRAHQAAAYRAAQLCTRYGLPAVRGFLRAGVPAEALQ